jgi:hypothetical protein
MRTDITLRLTDTKYSWACPSCGGTNEAPAKRDRSPQSGAPNAMRVWESGVRQEIAVWVNTVSRHQVPIETVFAPPEPSVEPSPEGQAPNPGLPGMEWMETVEATPVEMIARALLGTSVAEVSTWRTLSEEEILLASTGPAPEVLYCAHEGCLQAWHCIDREPRQIEKTMAVAYERKGRLDLLLEEEDEKPDFKRDFEK